MCCITWFHERPRATMRVGDLVCLGQHERRNESPLFADSTGENSDVSEETCSSYCCCIGVGMVPLWRPLLEGRSGCCTTVCEPAPCAPNACDCHGKVNCLTAYFSLLSEGKDKVSPGMGCLGCLCCYSVPDPSDLHMTEEELAELRHRLMLAAMATSTIPKPPGGAAGVGGFGCVSAPQSLEMEVLPTVGPMPSFKAPVLPYNHTTPGAMELEVPENTLQKHHGSAGAPLLRPAAAKSFSMPYNLTAPGAMELEAAANTHQKHRGSAGAPLLRPATQKSFSVPYNAP